MIFVHNGDFVDVVPVSVIEKIRAEIAEIAPLDYPCNKRTPEHIRDMALEIIDRYAEQAEIQADYDRQKASGMTDEEWEYGKGKPNE